MKVERVQEQDQPRASHRRDLQGARQGPGGVAVYSPMKPPCHIEAQFERVIQGQDHGWTIACVRVQQPEAEITVPVMENGMRRRIPLSLAGMWKRRQLKGRQIITRRCRP